MKLASWPDKKGALPHQQAGGKAEQCPRSPESHQGEEGRKGACRRCGVPQWLGCCWAQEGGGPDGPSCACPPKFRVSALFWIDLCLSWGQEPF